MPGYNYDEVENIDDAKSVEDAVRITIINYFHYQLGWTLENCERRVTKELNRDRPKGIFDMLGKDRGWNISDKKLLDIGSGQGGAVLEALKRGAEVYGVEPGAEFAALSRMRLEKEGYDPDIIIEQSAEVLPFEDNSFDYAISLQVLEHVSNPKAILEEIFRVLKPSGECWISCENYLSFREQHYRIGWLPMLPKWIGSLYLRSIGRDPSFLNNYVYYTTYPQIWRLCRNVGFENKMYDKDLEKIREPDHIKSRTLKFIAQLISYLPENLRNNISKILLHLLNVMQVGVKVLLRKPEQGPLKT